MVDGLVFSPTAHNHAVNYRSACIYAHQPFIIPNTASGLVEKTKALTLVTDGITGYQRCDPNRVGPPIEKEVKRTSVIRLRIEDASCKQRTGGWAGDKRPALQGEMEDEEVGEFMGVVPCSVQFGELKGVGRGRAEIEALLQERNNQAADYAENSAMAETSIDGKGVAG